MPVMTKLPADPFRPKGALDGSNIPVFIPKLTGDSSAPIVSPLSLPGGVAGYFDRIAAKDGVPTQHAPALQQHRRSQLYSPLSPGLQGPAPHLSSFFSPQLAPSTRYSPSHFDQQRSTSLPPETRKSFPPNRSSENGQHPQQAMTDSNTNGLAPTPRGAGNFAPTACPRSLSADAVAPTSHDQLVQRLLRQKARLLEAWEAERKYLEANRERAEEVYREERALMEEERAEWEAEKAILLAEIERLGGVNPLAGTSTRPWSRHMLTGYCGYGGTKGSSRVVVSPTKTQRPTQNGVPPHPNGTSTIPPSMVARAPDLASPRSLNGPSAPVTDFLNPNKGSADGNDPVPVVDVMEIDPELEGIRIKATSVKKPTFTDAGSRNGSKQSSHSGSPPSGSDQSKSPKARKEQTLEALAAEETERLTMHAGHTPSHSLSTLATVVSSGTATATSNGGHSTPTTTLPPHDGGAAEPGAAADDDDDDYDEYHPEPLLEASDDPELKGPLMVRNMPAHDEIFFQKLNDKLEEVSKDDAAALPAVLKEGPDLAGDEEEEEGGGGEEEAKERGVQGTHQAPEAGQAKIAPEAASSDAGSDAANGTGSKSGDDEGEDEEIDVPLKLKKPMNFGAPFGEVR
ncbi:hypothetical protein VTH82DRAFT_7706 [Thermothelomyces myriococcoides]